MGVLLVMWKEAGIAARPSVFVSSFPKMRS
jgi:hypothetical protein